MKPAGEGSGILQEDSSGKSLKKEPVFRSCPSFCLVSSLSSRFLPSRGTDAINTLTKRTFLSLLPDVPSTPSPWLLHLSDPWLWPLLCGLFSLTPSPSFSSSPSFVRPRSSLQSFLPLLSAPSHSWRYLDWWRLWLLLPSGSL